MLRIASLVFKIAVAIAGFFGLLTSPGCTGSAAIDAKIDFAVHVPKSVLAEWQAASENMQEAKNSDSSP